MNRKVLIMITIIVLLAVPTILLIASGDFYPKDQAPYDVGFITEKKEDTRFVQKAIDGLYYATLSENQDIKAKLYSASNSTLDAILDITTQAIGNHSEMILSAGYTNMEPLLHAARQYPNTSFVLVDADIVDLPENCANIVFRSNEPSFIAGYIAGNMPNTRIVGFLGGMPSDSVQKFYYGFKAGVEFASLYSRQNITLLTDYTNSFSNQQAGYDTAKKMYEDGADIIFAVAGDCGVGAILAAEELNRYIIGVDTDQNYLAPSNVLFSVTKNISGTVLNVVTTYAANKSVADIKDANGLISSGYAENGVDIETIIDAVPSPLKLEKDIIEQLIRDGNITVPATQDEYDAFFLPNLSYLK